MWALVQGAHIVHSSLHSRCSLGLTSQTPLSVCFLTFCDIYPLLKILHSHWKRSHSQIFISALFLFVFLSQCREAQAGVDLTVQQRMGLEPGPSSCLDLSDSGVTGVHHHAWPYFSISSTTTAPLGPNTSFPGAYILFTVFLRTFAFHTRPYLSSLCLAGSFFSITQRIINHAKGTKMGSETV